jgi:succinoglycan biosynthesis protein ExoA
MLVPDTMGSIMPLVSIIVPCYNEQNTIGLLLSALDDQSFDRSEMEVVIADGLSTDNTRAKINEFKRDHPDLCIQVIDNVKKTIPSGLNSALNIARGAYIVRLDAHSVPYQDYVARCVNALESGYGDNVGGVWDIRPSGTGWIARAIAIAASHPLAVGDAHYRLGGNPRIVDTVPFGAYRKSLLDKVGVYDETLLTNEDYELNVRIRQSGGKIWMDPQIRTIYFTRSSLSQLARQYWRYGFWKGRMIRRYPATLRWRQILPPLFILSFLLVGLIGIFFPLFSWLLLLEIGLYLLALFICGAQMALRKRDLGLLIGLPLAIIVMHFSWGSAFLWNFVMKSH